MASTSGRDKLGRRSLDSVNPLRLAAEGIPDALGNLTSMGLAVVASSVADGSDGFVALAWFDDASFPKHAFAAEGFLDPRCSRVSRASRATLTTWASPKARNAENMAGMRIVHPSTR